MTPTEARDLIENDADVSSAIRHAVSVLEEAVILEERERCAAVVEGFQTDQPGVGMSHWGKALATAIREGAPARPALAWTREPPKQGGQWWWYRSKNFAPTIVLIETRKGDGSLRMVSDEFGYSSNLPPHGEWYGPLEPPA